MTWADVRQGRAFLADHADRPLVESRWQARFPDASKRLELNQVVNFVSARMQVVTERLAVL